MSMGIMNNLSMFLLLLSTVFVHISHELLPRHHQLLMQVWKFLGKCFHHLPKWSKGPVTCSTIAHTYVTVMRLISDKKSVSWSNMDRHLPALSHIYKMVLVNAVMLMVSSNNFSQPKNKNTLSTTNIPFNIMHHEICSAIFNTDRQTQKSVEINLYQ